MAGFNKTKLLYCLLNVVLRMITIYIAYVIDNAGYAVKFTDTDYDVFTDAATHVANGGSPFARKTYRYTPLAAYVCLVNPWVHPLACKFVFVAFDIFIAYVLWDMVELQLKRSNWKAYSERTIALLVSTIMLNPMFFAMSSRGSNDQVIQALLLMAIYLVLHRWYVLGGFFFGLAIHFKIYPIIFSFVLYFFIDCDRDLIAQGGNPYWAIVSKNGFFTKNRLVFTALTVVTFFGLTAVFYPIYGYEYLYEAYLYHFVRKDHRHNNSVYWYLIYQLFDEPNSTLIGILTFVPQWALVIAAGITFYYDLFLAFFVQVWCFVMFNKVMTAQYYIWYMIFFPLILVNSKLIGDKKVQCVGFVLFWSAGQSVWGYYANAFENGGEQTFMGIHLTNCGWLIYNMGSCLAFIYNQNLHLQAEFVTDKPQQVASEADSGKKKTTPAAKATKAK